VTERRNRKGITQTNTYDSYDEAVDTKTHKIVCICKECGRVYDHPRATIGGTTGTLLKHNRTHEMIARKAEEKAGKISDIRTMFQPAPKPRITQNEFEVLCLRAMVASNWSFSQFEVPEFQNLLNGGYDLHIPSAKVMKVRLAKYAEEAREEIKLRLTNNESRISLALDCWTSPNRLEFMGMCLLLICSLIFDSELFI